MSRQIDTLLKKMEQRRQDPHMLIQDQLSSPVLTKGSIHTTLRGTEVRIKDIRVDMRGNSPKVYISYGYDDGLKYQVIKDELLAKFNTKLKSHKI